MTLGELPTARIEEVKIDDQKKIIPFLRRRKYKLFGAFYCATMIHPKDSTVEFEVSIGEYRTCRFSCLHSSILLIHVCVCVLLCIYVNRID